MGQVFNNRYKIKNKLGKGGSCLVFLISDETEKLKYFLNKFSYLIIHMRLCAINDKPIKLKKKNHEINELRRNGTCKRVF